MQTKHFLPLALLAVLLLYSCTTPKGISYFQDLQPDVKSLSIGPSADIRIRPKDQISIMVNTPDPKLTNLFNLPQTSQRIGQQSSTASSGSGNLSGYTVDSEGFINFPIMGKIEVAGLTREEIAERITRELIDRELVKDPVVTVEYMNLHFAVLGEVSNPGRYFIDRDRPTLLDALSQAGDLTIQGRRDNILVLREEGGKQVPHRINLCHTDSLLLSPVYYLQQNDVVYVEPNDMRKRQSTVNGNTVVSTSFWLSLASFFTTIIVLITN